MGSNKKALVLGVLLIVIVGLLFYGPLFKSFFQKTPSLISGGSEYGSATYTNKRIMYKFVLPSGYRLSSRVMEFMNTTGQSPIKNYSDENAEYVRITDSAKDAEMNLMDTIRQKIVQGGIDLNKDNDASFSFLLYLSSITAHDAIEIYPTSVGVEGIKNNKFYSNIKYDKFNGINVLRYSLTTPDGRVFAIAEVPFSSQQRLRGGDEIKGIIIKMEKDSQNFRQGAFNAIISSFQFVK